MRILIDADGCPVVDIAVSIAKQQGLECIILCDTSHAFEKSGAKTMIFSKGPDSVDFALVNMVRKDDIIITQDYGLAAMCLARNAVPISQDGMIFDDRNIDALLMQRHNAKKIRMAGGRLRGNSKRTARQDEVFAEQFSQLIIKSIDANRAT